MKDTSKEILPRPYYKKKFSQLLRIDIPGPLTKEETLINSTPERDRLVSLSASEWRKIYAKIKNGLVNGDTTHNWNLLCIHIFGTPLDDYEYRDLIINHPYITPLCFNWQKDFLKKARSETILTRATLRHK